MKIKRKVEMNEKELIKYLVDDENTTIQFSGISYDGAWLSIEPEIESKVHFEFKDASTNKKTFTVEVEEEITEYTKLDYMYLIASNTDYSEGYYNYSINDVLSDNEGYYKELAILIIDPEPTIIWTHDKGLVK